MKLAWLCYPYHDNDSFDPRDVQIKFQEPQKWEYAKIVPIVYLEIKE